MLTVIGRDVDLSVCQQMDEVGLPAVWCEIVSWRDCYSLTSYVQIYHKRH